MWILDFLMQFVHVLKTLTKAYLSNLKSYTFQEKKRKEKKRKILVLQKDIFNSKHNNNTYFIYKNDKKNSKNIKLKRSNHAMWISFLEKWMMVGLE